MRYDLCLPWYWEYDDVFVGMVERACIEEGISLWQIKPDNLLIKDNKILKISDLGLCRITRIKKWTDLDEGDSRYLAK